jgi:hypothetical protein
MKKFGFWTTVGGLAATIILVTNPTGVVADAGAFAKSGAKLFRAGAGWNPRKGKFGRG